MIEQLKGQYHGQHLFQETYESPEPPFNDNPKKVEEASKLLANDIMAYVKAMVSHLIPCLNASHVNAS